MIKIGFLTSPKLFWCISTKGPLGASIRQVAGYRDCFSPKLLREHGLSQHAPHFLQQGPAVHTRVHTLNSAILLRMVRYGSFVSDSQII